MVLSQLTIERSSKRLGLGKFQSFTATPRATALAPITRQVKTVKLPFGGAFSTAPITDETKKEARRISVSQKKDIRGGDFFETTKEIDHIIPVSLSGTRDIENLQALKSKKTIGQTVFDFFTGNKRLPINFKPKNRQEGKMLVEWDIINRFKKGELTLPQARFEIIKEQLKPKEFKDFLKDEIKKNLTGKVIVKNIKKGGLKILKTIGRILPEIEERLTSKGALEFPVSKEIKENVIRPFIAKALPAETAQDVLSSSAKAEIKLKFASFPDSILEEMGVDKDLIEEIKIARKELVIDFFPVGGLIKKIPNTKAIIEKTFKQKLGELAKRTDITKRQRVLDKLDLLKDKQTQLDNLKAPVSPKTAPTEPLKVEKVETLEPLAKEARKFESIQKIGNAQTRLDRNWQIREAERLSGGNRMKGIEIEKALKNQAIVDRQVGMNDFYNSLNPKYKIGDIVEVESKGLISKQKVKIEGADFNMQQSIGQMAETGFPASFRFDGLFGRNVKTGERLIIYSRYNVNGEILSNTIKTKPEEVLKEFIARQKNIKIGEPTTPKSQLTDIFNKAKEAKVIKAEVVKPKPTDILRKPQTIATPPTKQAVSVADDILKIKKTGTQKTSDLLTDSKAKIRQKGTKELPQFQVPEETKFQALQRNLQDKMNRLNVIQRQIKKTGKEISEEADAFLKQELFIGKAGERIDVLDREIITPMLKKAKKTGVDIDDLGSFLYAKHATERNIKITESFDKLNGSGMSIKQADNILNDFKKSGKLDDLEDIAKDFYKDITNQRLDILQKSGLETKETVDKLRQAYANYVPLKGKSGTTELGKIGQGFSITGKDVRRAFGRESRAKNPFIQAVIDLENTIVRAEKNEVAKSFLKLVEENPNKAIWEVENLQFKPRFDKTGELQFLDPKFKFADNVMQVKIDGKTKLITIKDQRLAEAMKNLGTERSFKFLNKFNTYLRSINTVMNPEFIITNFERDLQSALINVGGEQSLKMAKNTAKDLPKAMKGIFNNIRKGDTSSEWGKIYQELKDTGGKTGFFNIETIEDKLVSLNKKVNTYNKNKTTTAMKDMLRGLGDYINDMNEVVEMGVRTSAYNQALKNGVSKQKSASLAKNLTVNFNTKGNWGTMLNTLYLFSNAGIQGSTRVLRALKHKNVRKIVGGITVASFGLNEMNRAINEEEYKKITDFEKNTNMVFMLPNGNHFSIRLPYGFNIFKIMGDIGNEVLHKDITLGESAVRLLTALDDAYNPLSSGTLAQLISPTVTDPIVQIAENKNFFGSPIKPEQPAFGAKKRQSSLYWQSVRPQSKAITEWLNDITGGSEIEKGFIDVSPEIVDFFSDFIGGGVGKFISNTIGSTIDISKGEFPALKNIPFARQVFKEPSEFASSSVIRDVRDKSAVKELKEIDFDRLRTALKDDIKSERITQEDAIKTFKTITTNQAKIEAGKIFTELKKAEPSERAEIASDLNALELKELKKLFKKDFEKTEKKEK